MDRFRTTDGIGLFEQYWQINEAPRAVVVIVHGYGEHSGRYAHVVAVLNAHGYNVAAYDLRGHGQSGGRRGDVTSFDAYVNDTRQFVERVHARYPNLPLFLLAHSMGGAIAITLTLETDVKMAGVILCGAYLKPPPILRWGITFVRLLARFLPRLPTVRLDNWPISHDPAVIEAYQRDPLVYQGRMPLRVAAELLRIGKWLEAHMVVVDVPLLIMHGTADSLADPDGSRQLYAQASSTDKTLKLWDGFYHELLNEPDKEAVLAQIIDWLNTRSDG